MVLITILFLTGCGSRGNPTAKEIIKGNSDADMIQIDEIIFSRTANSYGESENGYIKGGKIGEIKKKSKNTLWYRNFYASKLPKGTEVFSIDEEYETGDKFYVILVDIDGELMEYHALIEG
ncbi:hypothetical protein [Sporosarcina sp. NPDC096371]|uniref:hypothetical protein n=1 Tax=Sporosarcina sp. NPDC096371 TaxID=3364530 RepID=UPI0037FFCC7A